MFYNANFIFKNAALFCNDKKLVIVLLIIQHAPIHLLKAICFNNLLEGLHFRALQINWNRAIFLSMNESNISSRIVYIDRVSCHCMYVLIRILNKLFYVFICHGDHFSVDYFLNKISFVNHFIKSLILVVTILDYDNLLNNF